MRLRPAVLAMLVLLLSSTPAQAGHHPATMTITAGPSGTIDTGNAEFRFSASKPDTDPVCRLTGPGQGGTFAACATSTKQTYSGLANGSYAFSVRDGRFSSAPVASRSFTVAEPDTTITRARAERPRRDAVTSRSPAGRRRRSSAGSTAATFAAALAVHDDRVTDEGPHTFEVRAVDTAAHLIRRATAR